MTIKLYDFVQGQVPLLISIPHLGTYVPPDVQACLQPDVLELSDTDWHLDQVYDFSASLGASVLSATHSRYVVDLNRPLSGESLYPGQTTTGLFPTETFRGDALYLAGREPNEAEQKRRGATYWQPYHDALQAELARLKALHGQVLLWEAHSIASVLPRLFDNRLPDLNLGTNSGESCSETVFDGVLQALKSQSSYNWVSNGRFKGGFITRHYGRPQDGIHAIQLEMSQCLYMDEQAPFAYLPERAEGVKPVIRQMLENALGKLQG